MSRHAAWLAGTLALVACAASPEPLPAPSSDRAPRAEPEAQPEAEVRTDQAVVYRLRERPASQATGELQVSSPVPGVLVDIDGEPGRTLPLLQALPAGLHSLEARCPDGTSERRTFDITTDQRTEIVLCPAH